MNQAILRLMQLSAKERARLLEQIHPGGNVVQLAVGEETAIVARTGQHAVAPVSFGQEQLWFLDQLALGVPMYNVPFAFHLDGPVDPGTLCATLESIARRHDILRTSLHLESERIVQHISPDVKTDLPVIDVSWCVNPKEEAIRLAKEMTLRTFNLTQAPLWRALLIRMDVHKHMLVWTSSHAVADGWSVSILLREIATLHSPLLRGERPALNPLPLQFADFAFWQHQRIADDRSNRPESCAIEIQSPSLHDQLWREEESVLGLLPRRQRDFYLVANLILKGLRAPKGSSIAAEVRAEVSDLVSRHSPYPQANGYAAYLAELKGKPASFPVE